MDKNYRGSYGKHILTQQSEQYKQVRTEKKRSERMSINPCEIYLLQTREFKLSMNSKNLLGLLTSLFYISRFVNWKLFKLF